MSINITLFWPSALCWIQHQQILSVRYEMLVSDIEITGTDNISTFSLGQQEMKSTLKEQCTVGEYGGSGGLTCWLYNAQ